VPDPVQANNSFPHDAGKTGHLGTRAVRWFSDAWNPQVMPRAKLKALNVLPVVPVHDWSSQQSQWSSVPAKPLHVFSGFTWGYNMI
jgi:hypothetical protein